MRTLHDADIFDWITRGRTPTPHSTDLNAERGVGLSCVLPLEFDRYGKILHRIDARYEHIDNPLSPEEINVLGIPDCDPLKKFVLEKRRFTNSTRVFWREAAELLGVPYAPTINHSWFSRILRPHPECWPRFLWGPAEGSLDEKECSELASILSTFSNQQDCYFRLAEIPFVGTDQPLLFGGSLLEVADYFGHFQFTPEYWWPADRRWCVCTDYDLDFTFVGGSAELVDLLLKSEVLECIEVNPDIRVDYLTPIPNDWS